MGIRILEMLKWVMTKERLGTTELELILGALDHSETAPLASNLLASLGAWCHLLSSWTLSGPEPVLLDVSSQLFPPSPLCPPGPLTCALGISDDSTLQGGNIFWAIKACHCRGLQCTSSYLWTTLNRSWKIHHWVREPRTRTSCWKRTAAWPHRVMILCPWNLASASFTFSLLNFFFLNFIMKNYNIDKTEQYNEPLWVHHPAWTVFNILFTLQWIELGWFS